jgi:hypothetical protein
MILVRPTLALVYATCAYVSATSIMAIWRSSHAQEIDWLYVMAGACISTLSIGTILGFIAKRKWAAAWAILLCSVIIFFNIGIAIIGIYAYGVSAEGAFGFHQVLLSCVAVTMVTLLCTPTFRRRYPTDTTRNPSVATSP